MMPKTIQFLALLLIGAVAANVRAQESLVESYLGEARAPIVRADYPSIHSVCFTVAMRLGQDTLINSQFLNHLDGVQSNWQYQPKP